MAKLIAIIAFCLAVPCYRCKDDNPSMDQASSLLENKGDGGNNIDMAALESIVGSLMQGDNAKNLGALLGQGGENAGDVLSSLGSLLGNAGDGKINPELIGSMINMFSQNMGSTEAPSRKKRETKDKEFNIGNKDAAKLMPAIMKAISSVSKPQAEKLAVEHKDHAAFLPPFVERLHVYWDLFINSDLGKTVWEKSELKESLQVFSGPDGKISYDVMFETFENRSVRRHWIKMVVKNLTDFTVHISKPEVYQGYITSAEFFINSFLYTQGLPKKTYFNSKKPEKSITALANYVLKKYMDIDTDVTEYVRPAVEYCSITLKMAEKLTMPEDTSVLADRLTDTLNLEIIEPLLRVYRAYKHSVKAPHCSEHLMCLLNKQTDKDKRDLPGFKASLTKLSSFAASAALSYHHGKSFWDMYEAIKKDENCEAAYPADCTSFHRDELKVTKEIDHSEL